MNIEIEIEPSGKTMIWIHSHYVKYEFDSFSEAIEALRNLHEVQQCEECNK